MYDELRCYSVAICLISIDTFQIEVTAIYGASPHDEMFMTKLKEQKQFRFTFTTPETFVRSPQLQQFVRHHVNTIVFDEAHCLTESGYDFR